MQVLFTLLKSAARDLRNECKRLTWRGVSRFLFLLLTVDFYGSRVGVYGATKNVQRGNYDDESLKPVLSADRSGDTDVRL